jgi:type IV secretory pathway TraG/TraD family ATPase VirD4
MASNASLPAILPVVNKFFSVLERSYIGPEVDEFNLPLLRFPDGLELSSRQLCRGVGIIASPDSGKTVTMLSTFARSFLRRQWGGLVLVVKPQLIADFRALVAAEKRQQDLIVFDASGSHRFNPLEGLPSAADAADLVIELSESLGGKKHGSSDNEQFWKSQLTIILERLMTLCQLQYGRFDLDLAAELFSHRANSPAALADPRWRQNNPLWAALQTAEKTFADNRNLRLAYDYFAREFPSAPDPRLQGNLAATVASTLDIFREETMVRLFSGQSTFSMSELLDQGKILLVAMPMEGDPDGSTSRRQSAVANALFQFCFCRSAAKRGKAAYWPAFLLADECQHTISYEFRQKLGTLRESRIAVVLTTQLLQALKAQIGEHEADSILGLLSLKVFLRQQDGATAEWISKEMGEHWVERESKTSGSGSGARGSNSSSSTTRQKVRERRVYAEHLTSLEQGESWVLFEGQVQRCRWHLDRPGKGGTVALVE